MHHAACCGRKAHHIIIKHSLILQDTLTAALMKCIYHTTLLELNDTFEPSARVPPWLLLLLTLWKTQSACSIVFVR
jgi:hypothetical protein